MNRAIIGVSMLLLAVPAAHARPKWKKVLIHAAEHVALGAGTEVAVSQVAGGPRKYWAGITAAGIVAGFKEGTDAVAGRDTKKQAAWHALTIMAGAGIAAAARHK